MRERDGDLSLGTAKIGAKVRCVKIPDIRLWQERFKLQCFHAPCLGKEYVVRGNVLVHQGFGGVLLREIRNPDVVILLASGIPLSGEPFFPYSSFVVVGSVP